MTERARTTLIGVAMAIGFSLSLWGLAHMEWPRAVLWSYVLSSGLRYVSFLLVCAMVAAIGLRRSRLNPLLAGGVLCAGLALMAGAFWPLLVTLWFALSSAIVGKGILSALRVDKSSRNWATNFLVGAGAYGTAVGLLAHFPASYPGIYGAALIVPLIVGRRSFLELSAAIRTWCVTHGSPKGRASWLEVSITVVALVHFVVALMPEVGHDALAMHLFVPAHLALRHQWGFDVGTYVWAVMPMLGAWIFSIGYMLAGETAARLINVGFIFVLTWLIRDLVIWAGRGTASGARWAVLIFLSTPLTFTVSSSLFVESVWASFVVAGALAILRTCSSRERENTDLPVAGILLGYALAAKAVAFAMLLTLLLFLALRCKLWLRAEFSRQLAIGLSLFIVLGAIPYVTAWWLTGNPVFPFFNGVFQSPYYPPVNFESPLFEKGLKWDTIYQVTFNSGKYLEARAGAAGFQWLLLFLPAVLALSISWHRRGLALLVAGVLSVALTFQFTAYLRYVFPSVALLCGVIGLLFSEEFAVAQLRKFILIVAGLAVGLNMAFLNAGAFYRDFPLKSIFSERSREVYLQDRLPIRNAVRLVNSLNTERTPVAVFSSPLTAGLEADALYPNWYNHQFESLINAADTEHAVAEVLLDKGVDFIILDAYWGTAEKRLLIEEATDKILDCSWVTVRSIRQAYRFQTELLRNTTFSTSAAWTLSNAATIRPGSGILVSVTSPAIQVVSVKPGQRYLMTVRARCESQPTQGRMQVNWLNSKSQFIRTSIRVFECTTYLVEHSLEVVAPERAAFAVVYATGHTSVPLLFVEVSFRH